MKLLTATVGIAVIAAVAVFAFFSGDWSSVLDSGEAGGLEAIEAAVAAQDDAPVLLGDTDPVSPVVILGDPIPMFFDDQDRITRYAESVTVVDQGTDEWWPDDRLIVKDEQEPYDEPSWRRTADSEILDIPDEWENEMMVVWADYLGSNPPDDIK